MVLLGPLKVEGEPSKEKFGAIHMIKIYIDQRSPGYLSSAEASPPYHIECQDGQLLVHDWIGLFLMGDHKQRHPLPRAMGTAWHDTAPVCCGWKRPDFKDGLAS